MSLSPIDWIFQKYLTSYFRLTSLTGLFFRGVLFTKTRYPDSTPIIR